MLALLGMTSFWPPSMVYISVISTHITNYNLSHVGPLWAAFMYCIYTCLLQPEKTVTIISCLNSSKYWPRDSIYRSIKRTSTEWDVSALTNQATMAGFEWDYSLSPKPWKNVNWNTQYKLKWLNLVIPSSQWSPLTCSGFSLCLFCTMEYISNQHCRGWPCNPNHCLCKGRAKPIQYFF